MVHGHGAGTAPQLCLSSRRLAAHGLNTATFSRRRRASARKEAAEERDTLMMSYPRSTLTVGRAAPAAFPFSPLAFVFSNYAP